MENDSDDKLRKAHEAASKLSTLFTGCGIPGSIARILAGALIGALATVAIMSQSGCMVKLDIMPRGEKHIDSSFMLPQPATVTEQK